NGSAWFISGKPDDRWNNDNLHMLGNVLGSDFEAIDGTLLMIDPNTGQAKQNGVVVTVTPSSATLHIGTSKQFTASVTGTTNQSVNWSSSNGFISTSGLYNAPSPLPSPPTATITATSAASATSSGSATVTLLPLPNISSLSPSPLSTGNF